jgi:hypothetical protein
MNDSAVTIIVHKFQMPLLLVLLVIQASLLIIFADLLLFEFTSLIIIFNELPCIHLHLFHLYCNLIKPPILL